MPSISKVQHCVIVADSFCTAFTPADVEPVNHYKPSFLPSAHVRWIIPASQLLHLPVLLLLQFGNKTLQDRHLKFDVLRHLEQQRATAVSHVNLFVCFSITNLIMLHFLADQPCFTHTHFIRNLFSQILLHEKDLADVLTWSLKYSHY